VFYDAGSDQSWGRYLEAACAGWSDGTCGGSDLADPQATWGCFGTAITGAGGTAIGTGEQNTTDIVVGCPSLGIAARLADNLVVGGQSDWFLPSRDELNQMYIQRAAIGGFSAVYYWSSSEVDGNSAQVQYFLTGDQGVIDKYFTPHVRPVRAF